MTRGRKLASVGNAKLLSAAAGLGMAYALHALLYVPQAFQWPASRTARVTVRAAAAPETPVQPSAPGLDPTKAKTQAVLPLKTTEPLPTPAKPQRPKPQEPTLPPVGETSATGGSPDAPLERFLQNPLPQIAQPPLSVPRAKNETQALPRLGEAVPALNEQAQSPDQPASPGLASSGSPGAAPPVPSAIPEFKSALAQFEKAGGDVLVLALLVNDAGVVVDSRIVVNSSLGLQDLAAALTYLGKQWQDIQPPMLPGEYRWFEVRIDQLRELQRGATLP